MSRRITVAGSGKMARDVGLFFLSRGNDVVWLSRDAERLDDLRHWVERKVRRLAKTSPETAPGAASFFLVGDTAMPKAEIFIECINEAEAEKRELLRELEPLIPHDTVRVTNSSSIFPDALHSRCAGLHFFYPVELTGLVEAVFPPEYPPADRAGILALLADSRLECIEEEGEGQAFAVNRLLLPIQAEAVRLLRAGVDPIDVDRASTSDLLPAGQLALMDAIGLDVVGPAVRNYRSRMDGKVSEAYAELDETLDELLARGKRGRKNKNGFLLGDPLPWLPRPDVAKPKPELFRCLFVNTCHHALELKLLHESELALALEALFGWAEPLERALGMLSPEEALEVLERAFEVSRRAYLVPAMKLSSERRRENSRKRFIGAPF